MLMVLTTGKVEWRYTCQVFGVLLVMTTVIAVLMLLQLHADSWAIPRLVSIIYHIYNYTISDDQELIIPCAMCTYMTRLMLYITGTHLLISIPYNYVVTLVVC